MDFDDTMKFSENETLMCVG